MMTFFDIGANVGLYICLAAKVAESGSVHTFEPHPDNIRRLHQNIELNKLTEVVDVHEFAVSDSSGEFDLAVHGSSDPAEGRHSLVTGSDIGETVPISTYSGDQLVGSEIPKPDIIKIDVEGTENRVLNGFKNTLENTIQLYIVNFILSSSKKTVLAVRKS